MWPGVVGPHCWALPSDSGKELVSLAAPEGRALGCVCVCVGGYGGRGGGMQVEEGWVGGDTAKDMGPLARWVWRRLGWYVVGVCVCVGGGQ